MEHVMSTETSPRPYMDRLTHAILKEASKSLKYYIDVKSREDAFVLDANTPVWDLLPKKSKFVFGANNKQHADKHSFQYKPKQLEATLPSPEKQMYREELQFHMRSYSFLGKENPKLCDVPLRSKHRSSSLNVPKRQIRSRSTLKLSRDERDHLIDNTADIFASMVNSRRSLISHFSQRSDIVDTKTLPKQSKNSSNKTTSFIHNCPVINKGLQCDYKVTITTGNCNGASTNAPIRIKLYGTNGHTAFHELVHSETHHVPFLKNQTDMFIVHTYHVGMLMGITIGHNRKDMKASWYLDKVSIDDPVRRVTCEISCNGWLSIKSNDQKTMRDFPVISTISYEKKKTLVEGDNEIDSQSGFSTITTTVTTASNKSHSSKVSNGPRGIAEKPSELVEIIQFLVEPTAQPRSPVLSATSSDDTAINVDIAHQLRSQTSTPSPTLTQTRLKSVSEHDILEIKPTNDIFHQYSTNFDRPSARLERRTTPLTFSPEQND
ncbi:unnamed protein product [Adineta ricciae]|uniref:PLAT domain-containing protein n=1 Tax=Adineta ricciae TaxID=249248 RepID=A0A815CY38_ADIRI|nr:unnamed protein product [Adineta ricciae]